MPDAMLDSQVDSFGYEEDDEDGNAPARDLKVALKPQSTGPLITLDAARAKIGENVLQVLDARFKGELSEVRHLDDQDLLD